jgi:hypothetical protein
MKHIILGLLLSAAWGVSQAGSMAIDNTSPISFSGYDRQPSSVTGSESKGFRSSPAATSAGAFTATYFGTSGALLESGNLGATNSLPLDAYLLSLNFSNNAGSGHTFRNGSQQQLPLGFAIMRGQTDKFGTFDYLVGFNDNYGGVANHADFLVNASIANVAPVPEPRIYAMMLAGLGLIGFSARRRTRDNFD